ncbi:DNA repair protein RadC [Xanthomonas hortorum pv. pelargonii]|nr:DNA repair protein RadC [Xanthomonas hortorum pv. pelargonii]
MGVSDEHRQSRHMHIHDWPTDERPREKLLARGATALSDAELLAIFVGSGLRGQDAVRTARDLLLRHGPLRVLLDRPASALARLPGLGPASSCKLNAALELAHRHLMSELERGEALSDPPSVGRYFSQRLRAKAYEVFAVLYLDTKHHAIAFEEVFTGTLDGADIHTREVVRRALLHNAAAVIVGHNHPSGNPEPSEADRAVAKRLLEALDLMEIRLLDHFVIGDGRPVSLAERGWLE